MSAKLENKSSSATLVDPPSTSHHLYRYARPVYSQTTNKTSPDVPSHEVPEVPPLPERAAGHGLVSRTHGGSEGSEQGPSQSEVTSPASPFSASFNPNGPTPAQISSFPTPPTLIHSPVLSSQMKPAPPSQYSDLSSQASPFSPSFDPNATNSHTAHTPQRLHPRLSASSLSSSAGSIHVAQEQWNQIMSASLSALANQFQNASRIIHSSGSEGTSGSRHPHDGGSASYGTSVSGDAEGAEDTISELALARATAGGVGMQGVETMLSLMMSRLENVERNQVRLGGEVERMRDELKELKEDMGTKVEPTPTVKSEGESGYFGTYNSEKAKMKGKEVKIEVEAEAGAEVRDTKDAEDWQKRVEALESKIESIQETIKVEQARLYPRLQNAFVTLNKQVIKPLPMQGTGKAPVNFPATKGEFEHVTKERYEQLLKAYGLPIKGDTAAKREAVREFIGLTQPGK